MVSSPPVQISEMSAKEILLGGTRLPGAMVDLAFGLKVPGKIELFLGGISHAMLLRPTVSRIS